MIKSAGVVIGLNENLHSLSRLMPYIDRCVPFQIMYNQFNLPQVGSNEGVEKNQEKWEAHEQNLKSYYSFGKTVCSIHSYKLRFSSAN